MGNILQIKGKVQFTITLDPAVWIFDDRKIDINTYFEVATEQRPDELSQYQQAISKQWDREITEGVTIPATIEKKSQKQQLLAGTFGIVFKPFLNNAQPLEDAKTFIIEMDESEVELALSEASDLVLCFSKEGPIKEGGPIHIYYGDGSNKQNPFKNIKGFRVE